ncbi:hypothetical protein TNCV_71191 [Trichonephila clavipes]|nr:hypothetical protein TNCV_71191 [Trichonephila clavipes]
MREEREERMRESESSSGVTENISPPQQSQVFPSIFYKLVKYVLGVRQVLSPLESCTPPTPGCGVCGGVRYTTGGRVCEVMRCEESSSLSHLESPLYHGSVDTLEHSPHTFRVILRRCASEVPRDDCWRIIPDK